MLWFNQFFGPIDGECFELAPQRIADLPLGYSLNGSTSTERNGHASKGVVARAGR